MKPQFVIPVLLILACGAGDLALMTYIQAKYQVWPDLPGVVLLSMAFGQTVLLAGWAVFSRLNIVIRVVLVFAVTYGLSLAAGLATAVTYVHFFALLSVAFCVEALLLGVLKCFRFDIHAVGDIRAALKPGWQFSIWGLLSATTALAIILGVAQHFDMPLQDFGSAIAFFSCMAATGLTVYIVTMLIKSGLRSAIVSFALVMLACPPAGIAIGNTGLPPEEFMALWGLFGFCYGAMIAGSAGALRIAGYRLGRADQLTPEFDSAEAAGDSESIKLLVQSLDPDDPQITNSTLKIEPQPGKLKM